MKIKEGFILRSVAGETVVLPSDRVANFDMMITLNETGRFLWERLAQGAELPELVDALLQEYDVDRATAEKSAEAFVNRMKELDFLV